MGTLTDQPGSRLDASHRQRTRRWYVPVVSVVEPRSLAERKREVVREALATAAAKLLRDRAYEAITIDDIARTAGVSRRTFFRYFPTKEDVFLAMYSDFGRAVHARLAERPAEESPARSLRQAFRMEPNKGSAEGHQLAKTTMAVPALYARHLELLALWRKELAAELAARSRIDLGKDVRPEVAAAVALAAFDTALNRWVESDGPEAIEALLDECFAPVEDAINAMLMAPRRDLRRVATYPS
jgi:AcrR family transcriptional regulator